ncbi:hypothetical protein [Spongiivirga citrea]|uniref:Uncharacterized protein n=1 Tax=Spongiivirga citrea TaxID=1481457 RepID=A0A6M0CE37_9FLAO|nr:hypothetical protein [Spongiivirga citrea]NER16086.1 hypothetical protein [Spongiivirga citrea]
MEIVIKIFLGILGVYTLIGILFGVFFLIKAPKIDPLMADTKKKVRFLLFPGVAATWPFLIGKLFNSKTA